MEDSSSEPSVKPWNRVKEIPLYTYNAECKFACNDPAITLPTRALLQAAGIDDYTDDSRNQPHLSSSGGLTDEDKEDIIDYYEDQWIAYWSQVIDITDDEQVIFKQFLSTKPATLPTFLERFEKSLEW